MRSPSLLLLICAIGSPSAVDRRNPCLPSPKRRPSPGPRIPFGFEAVTGYRSRIRLPRFQLGQHVIDFQLEGGSRPLDRFAAPPAPAAGTPPSQQSATSPQPPASSTSATSGPTGLSASPSPTTASPTRLFETASTPACIATWAPTEDLFLTLGGYYDGGPDGWYGRARRRLVPSHRRPHFISMLAGTSWLDRLLPRAPAGTTLYARPHVDLRYQRPRLDHPLRRHLTVARFQARPARRIRLPLGRPLVRGEFLTQQRPPLGEQVVQGTPTSG